ncbi:hypothetical protein L1987_21804 [Smallanthus sonchifolius]|uniref:Uncharacterized protein n=1 Tax=Smallanthus sonchifolius TaxID=185202 RepID=A0ACB9IEK8_9ASTR|nr:hypothetical protein L1987_21804 [Smallanthus sonchifolius]
MSPRTVGSSRHAIETCIFKLHSWRPFQLPTAFNKTLEKSDNTNSKNPTSSCKPHKRPCLSDRATSFSIENLDMSKLSLFDDDGGSRSSVKSKRERIHWLARKRRRRGSKSVSGRSSDQSGTRRRCCSVGASNAYGTCSDFMMANNAGTDSSGELFVNGGGVGDVNWASDASEVVARSLRRESTDKENLNSFSGLHHHYGNLDSQGNESGYGSEPGYRGDAEFGYGDEFDEEEDDTRLLFWGNKFGDALNTEIKGENTLQKAHHRVRRKKHELRMIDAV